MRSKYHIPLLAISLLAVIFLSGCAKSEAPVQQSCEDVLNLTQRNSCYERLALAREKTDYCEKILTPDPFNSGRMECYIRLAEQTGNTSLCFIYNRYDSSAICIREIAMLMNDSSVCEMDGMETDVCYLALAVKKSRVEVCDNISSSEIRQKCIDEIEKGIKYYCINYEAC
jgi:hypothetical protein